MELTVVPGLRQAQPKETYPVPELRQAQPKETYPVPEPVEGSGVEGMC